MIIKGQISRILLLKEISQNLKCEVQLYWLHWQPEQLKGETSFPQGFQVREEKVPSGCSPFCQVSVITENLFTKCSEFIFQEFKAYFIGSSGHWKILYSFPSDLAHYFGTRWELTHLANHLDFPDAQKEVSKVRKILDGKLCSLCPNPSMKTTIDIQRWGWGQEAEEKRHRGSSEKRKWDMDILFWSMLHKLKT